eukprot:200453-Pelagomonas_calceolata.AAC.2
MTSPHKAGMKERKKTFDPTRTMREPVRIDGANIYALFAGSTEYAGTILISVAKCNVHLSAPTMTPGRYLKCQCPLPNLMLTFPYLPKKLCTAVHQVHTSFEFALEGGSWCSRPIVQAAGGAFSMWKFRTKENWLSQGAFAGCCHNQSTCNIMCCHPEQWSWKRTAILVTQRTTCMLELGGKRELFYFGKNGGGKEKEKEKTTQAKSKEGGLGNAHTPDHCRTLEIGRSSSTKIARIVGGKK